jgi:hypothetical protein
MRVNPALYGEGDIFILATVIYCGANFSKFYLARPANSKAA